MTTELKDELSEFNVSKKNMTVQVRIDCVVYEGGVEVMRKQKSTRSFMPGRYDEISNFVGDIDIAKEVAYLQSVWTDEVVEKYTVLNTVNDE